MGLTIAVTILGVLVAALGLVAIGQSAELRKLTDRLVDMESRLNRTDAEVRRCAQIIDENEARRTKPGPSESSIMAALQSIVGGRNRGLLPTVAIVGLQLVRNLMSKRKEQAALPGKAG